MSKECYSVYTYRLFLFLNLGSLLAFCCDPYIAYMGYKGTLILVSITSSDGLIPLRVYGGKCV